jgi:hypothetical protein
VVEADEASEKLIAATEIPGICLFSNEVKFIATTFSIEISEFWEAFRNFRKSGNSFPDFRNFGRFLTTGTVFGPIPNIMYDTDFLFIAVVRRMFQKRRGSRSCIPKRVTNPSEILGRFPKFGKVPKIWEGSQILGRFPKFGKVPKFWEGSQNLGRFPKFGKVPKFWEGSQILGRFPKFGKHYKRERKVLSYYNQNPPT